MVSSACWWQGGVAVSSGLLMGWTSPASVWSLRWTAKGCAAMTNSRGDSGLPCAKPLSTRKIGKCQPLNLSLAVSFVCSRSTHLRAEVPVDRGGRAADGPLGDLAIFCLAHHRCLVWTHTHGA